MVPPPLQVQAHQVQPQPLARPLEQVIRNLHVSVDIFYDYFCHLASHGVVERLADLVHQSHHLSTKIKKIIIRSSAFKHTCLHICLASQV